jgi:hypothetical protein
VRFENVCVLSRFDRERIKKCFLVSNVSTGNVTLCHWQHIRELRVERSCLRLICEEEEGVRGGGGGEENEKEMVKGE